MKVKLGLIQSRISPKPQENLEEVISSIKALAKEGVQIVCLSELFSSPYFCQTEDKRFFEWAETIPGKTTETLSQLAQKLGIVLIASLYERAGHDLYNTALVIDADGALLGKYRKTHIPDDLKNYYGEAFYFKKGDLGYPVFKTRFGTIGVLVCWDQWFPEAARSLAKKGAEIIFYPTAIGYQVSGVSAATNQKEREAWQTIQRSHAIANGVFVAAVNRVGREDHLNFWGSSFVAGPSGEIVAEADDHNPALLRATCDLSLIEQTRSDWPFLKNLNTPAYD